KVTLIGSYYQKRAICVAQTSAHRIAEGAIVASCCNGSRRCSEATATGNVAASAIGLTRGDVITIRSAVLSGREQRSHPQAAPVWRFPPDRVVKPGAELDAIVPARVTHNHLVVPKHPRKRVHRSG